MAASGSPSYLSPASSSCQIAGRPIPVPRHAPTVKIRYWRRFAASSSQVSLAPARLLRATPRRRNALREKASPQPSHQGASPSGDVAADSKLDELDVIGYEKEAPLCETGAGPAFGVYNGPQSNVMQFQVDEDEIIKRSEAAEGEESGDLESISSLARAMAMQPESRELVAPNCNDNSTRVHFAAAETMGSSVLNGEVSVARRNNVSPSRSITWSGFAALCGICIIFGASKLTRSSSKAQFRRKLFDMQWPEMKEAEPGSNKVDLLRRPLLDRKELKSNIKRAQDSRKWSVLSNPFCRKDVAVYDDTNIQEIRRNVAEVHTSEEGILEKYCTKKQNGIVITQPIDVIEEEVSACHSSQSYEVLDSSESNDISLFQDKIVESMEKTVDLKNSESNGFSLSKDKIEESMEQAVDLKNGAQIMSMSDKGQGNIGKIESPEPTYSNERGNPTKEAQIGSVNVHKLGPNGVNIPPSDFESKDIEATRNSANVAHTTCHEEFSHNVSILDTEACKTAVMAETVMATSPQRSRENPAGVRSENVRSMQEMESSISSGNVKQPSHGTENEHKEKIVHNKIQTRTERDHTGILNDAGIQSFCTLEEQTVHHTFAEGLQSEKQGKNKPKARVPKKKGKLQMNSSKEAKTDQSEQGNSGTETVVNPTNHVQETKGVKKKRQKKVNNEMQRVPALDAVQCSSMVDQKNNNQKVKRARRKNPKNVFHNQGAQTREENPETTHVINSPGNATTDNMKPLAVGDSSMGTQFSMDGFSEDQ